MKTFAMAVAVALALGSMGVEARYVHPHDRANQMYATSKSTPASEPVDFDTKDCEARATMRQLTGTEREAFLDGCNATH